MRYIDVTGKTEEEAVRKALEQLHLERDDVSLEILERSKSGFLGIGSSPAKVRVRYELDVVDEPEVKTPAPQAKPAEKKAAESKPVEKKPAEKKPAERKPVEKKPEPKPVEKKPEGKELTSAAACDNDDARRITEFLAGLLEHMECKAEIKVYEEEKNRYKVILEGQRLGALIGRRGETLDAIQQLTNYAVNHGQSKRVRIHIDAEGYRAKREESLQRLAVKVAGKVVKYRKNMTLEPMNAYERHVIHAALQDYPNVTTYSTGVEPNRRTVVAYAPGQK